MQGYHQLAEVPSSSLRLRKEREGKLPFAQIIGPKTNHCCKDPELLFMSEKAKTCLVSPYLQLGEWHLEDGSNAMKELLSRLCSAPEY